MGFAVLQERLYEMKVRADGRDGSAREGFDVRRRRAMIE
jgi:hypothetical protein